MKRFVILVMLVACGDKKEPAPAAVVADVVKVAPTPLAEARQILTTTTKRDPTAWVALAHAQAVAKLPEAKATLDAALAAARADAGREGTVALVHAVEVLDALGDPNGAAKLLDEAVVRLASAKAELPSELLSPASHLTHAPTIDRIAQLAVDDITVLESVVAWCAPEVALVVARKVHAIPDRALLLTILAERARRTGTPEVALLEEAARIPDVSPDDKMVIATEAALSGAPALAKKLVEGIPKIAHAQEAALRANTFAVLAMVHALAGDKAGSQGFEKKALQAAEKDSEDIDDEAIWRLLGVARAKRGDADGAIELVRERLTDALAATRMARDLVDAGELEVAKRALLAMEGEAQFAATAAAVELLAMRDLDAAQQLALASPAFNASFPGLDHVMRGYALRGDLATVRELGTKDRAGTKTLQLDAFTDLTARTLARQGKCDEAIAAARGVTANRGECLAVIARYCPNPKR